MQRVLSTRSKPKHNHNQAAVIGRLAYNPAPPPPAPVTPVPLTSDLDLTTVTHLALRAGRVFADRRDELGGEGAATAVQEAE